MKSINYYNFETFSPKVRNPSIEIINNIQGPKNFYQSMDEQKSNMQCAN